MPKTGLTLILSILCITTIWGQFAPAAGQPGSKAVHKDSSSIIAWATHCTVQRGPMDISQPGAGLATAGMPHQATGMAGDGLTVSLGDGGQATLTFQYPIRNENGPDFVVFENAFNATFLELALVEVSSDGQNFVRFPAISNTDTNTQVGSFGSVDPTKLYNLAGKYRAGYGTPFDLEELIADSAILDLNAVTHVRLIDAVGSMQNSFASRDSRGIKINDPWKTPFPSSGFDLDAIGVLHNNTNIAITRVSNTDIHIFPNPIRRGQKIYIKELNWDQPCSISIHNVQGQLVFHQKNLSKELSTHNLEAGCYILRFQSEKKQYMQQLIIR